LPQRLKRKLEADRYLLKLLMLKAVFTTGVAIELVDVESAAAATGVVLVVATGATNAAVGWVVVDVADAPTEMIGIVLSMTGAFTIGVSRSDSDEKSKAVGKV